MEGKEIKIENTILSHIFLCNIFIISHVLHNYLFKAITTTEKIICSDSRLSLYELSEPLLIIQNH
jgi:hypothetical protein